MPHLDRSLVRNVEGIHHVSVVRLLADGCTATMSGRLLGVRAGRLAGNRELALKFSRSPGVPKLHFATPRPRPSRNRNGTENVSSDGCKLNHASRRSPLPSRYGNRKTNHPCIKAPNNEMAPASVRTSAAVSAWSQAAKKRSKPPQIVSRLSDRR